MRPRSCRMSMMSSRYFLAPNSSSPVTSILKTSIGSISALQQPRDQERGTYCANVLCIWRNRHLDLKKLLHGFWQTLYERSSAHHDHRLLHLDFLQLLLVDLLS